MPKQISNLVVLNNSYIKTFQACKNFTRQFSSKLTHVDESGQARMVDVGVKEESQRTAEAEATITVGSEVAGLIITNSVAKGDVLTVAELAGVLAAKHTSELIPLCHNISLSRVIVRARLEGTTVRLTASVKCYGRTGAEMEALTAVSVAALTVYDMCKAVNRSMIISDIRLLSKTGGKSGDYFVSK